MFREKWPLADLKGADYNPRLIEEASLAKLAESLTCLGSIKPLIVSGTLIVAGHQRTKVMRRLGWTHAPAYVLPAGVKQADEVAFNQLHNGTELDAGDEEASVGKGAKAGWDMVPPKHLKGKLRGKYAVVRTEICRLMTLWGNWGSCIVTQDGRVLHGAQYVLACIVLGEPCRVYRLRPDQEAAAIEHLGRQYGRFSYDHLPKRTYIQTFAQRLRLRSEGKQQNTSQLYEAHVIPELKPGERILDFGCGQADYVKKLKREGKDIHGVEFFHRTGDKIDTAKVHRMIDDVCATLRQRGRFDVVLCDHVLSAVDSLTAQDDVAACLNALCRPGGRIYVSMRFREWYSWALNSTTATNPHRRYLEFLDPDGFTAMLRDGEWFYQKYHTKEQTAALATEFWSTGFKTKEISNTRLVWGVKTHEIPHGRACAALSREFDLPWPGNKRVGRSAAILKAFDEALSKEG
jgi:ParB family chromosome partitioning protein